MVSGCTTDIGEPKRRTFTLLGGQLSHFLGGQNVPREDNCAPWVRLRQTFSKVRKVMKLNKKPVSISIPLHI